MSEVTGQIGSDQVYLENAATEATLQQLLRATLAQSTGNKSLIAQMAQKVGLSNESVDQANKGTNLLGTTARATGAAFGIVTGITTGLGSAFQGVIGWAEQLANNGGEASKVLSALNFLPFGIGKVAEGLGQLEKMQEQQLYAYQKLTAAGANLGGNLDRVRLTAGKLNLTLDQFADLISKNGEALSRFGTTTETGLNTFIKISSDLNNGSVGRGLRGLGYTSEQLNQHLMTYIQMSGGRTKDELSNTSKITQQTKAYLTELDRLAQITGQSREELEKKMAEEANEASWQLWLSTQDEETRVAAMASLQKMTGLYGKAGADIVKATAMQVAVQGEAGQQLIGASADTARYIAADLQIRRRGGDQTNALQENENRMRAANVRDANRMAGAAATYAGVFDKNQEFMQRATEANNRQQQSAADFARQTDEIAANQATREQSQAAAQAEYQVAMLKMANEVTSLLLSLRSALSPIKDLLISGLMWVINWIDAHRTQIIGAFSWLATKIEEFAMWLGSEKVQENLAKFGTLLASAGEILEAIWVNALKPLGQHILDHASLYGKLGLAIIAFMGTLALVRGVRGAFSLGGGAAAAAGGGARRLGEGVGAGAFKGLSGLARGLVQLGNPKAMLGAVTLGLVGGAIFITAKGFKEFAGVNWVDAGIGIAVITGISALAAVGGQVAGVGLGALGLGLGIFSGALWIFGKALKEITGAGVTSEYLTQLGMGMMGLVNNMPYAQMIAASPGMATFGVAALALAPGLTALAGINVNPTALTNIGTGLKGMVDDNMPYNQMDYAAEGMEEFGKAAPILAAGIAALSVIDPTKLPAIGSSIKSFFDNLPDLSDGWFEDSVGEKIAELGEGFGPLATNLNALSKFNPSNLILIHTFFNAVVAAKLGNAGLIIFTDHTIGLMRQFTLLPLQANIDQIVRLKDVAIREMPAATTNIDRFNTSLGNLLKADVAKIRELASAIGELKTSMSLSPNQDTSAIESVINRVFPGTAAATTTGTGEAGGSGPYPTNTDLTGNINQIIEQGLEQLNNNIGRLLNISNSIEDNTRRVASKATRGQMF